MANSKSQILVLTGLLSFAMASNQKTLLYLKEIEDAADLVLTNKQEIVDLDRKRNSNREALSAFEKQMK